MAAPRVLVRADAGPTIGIGHVMRCLTLGTALQRHGAEVRLASVDLPAALADAAAEQGIAVGVPPPVGDLGRAADLVVVDGYHLGETITHLVETGARVAVLDDNADLPVDRAAYVLNQNMHATAAMYPDTTGRLLLGPRYALLRDAITTARRPAPSGTVERIVVSLGGADPLGHTLPLATALADRGYHLRLAIGAANPRREELLQLISRRPETVSADRGDLVESLVWADLAVIGAGTTLWEVAHLGLPAVATIIADNQILGGAAATDAGIVTTVDLRDTTDVNAAVNAVEALAGDEDARARMARIGPDLFDGSGADRAAQAMLERG